MLLSSKVAIVTGGAKGIGKGISLKYAEEGCSIAIADILEADANQTLKEISEKGAEGIFIKCDHTDSQQVNNMVEKVMSKFGKIDILVNNAGGFGPPVPITELTEEEWDRSVKLNLKGTFLTCKAVITHMIEKKSGRIINIASIAAITSGPPSSHYASAKGGVMSLTIDLAGELGRHGICVNAILPGTIRTDMWKTQYPPDTNEDEFFKQMGINNILLQRPGYPEDVAGAALFYASEYSSYVTGDRILVSGGLPLPKG